MIFRTTLKNWLALLAKWALKKHKIKLVVVSGWFATETAKELAYTVIGIKHKVRRINKNPWWDLSIPLAVLGYKDEQRSMPQWIWLIVKSIVLLVFGKSNPHTLVLNLNYADEDTLKYWNKLVEPQILVIHNLKQEHNLLKQMIVATMKVGGTIIIQYPDYLRLSKTLSKYEKVMTIGCENQADIVYDQDKQQNINFKYQQKNYSIKKKAMPGINCEILACSLAVAITEDIQPLDALYAMVKYPIGSKLLSKLKSDLLA